MNRLLKPKDVAELLGCQLSTVYSWAGQGKIPAYKLNGSVRFDSKEVERWVKDNRIQPVDPAQVKRALKPKDEVDVDAIVKRTIDSFRN